MSGGVRGIDAKSLAYSMYACPMDLTSLDSSSQKEIASCTY